jgi:toxin secretion/phage lysis holin
MTKNILISIVGIIGSAIASAFGGWTTGLTTLVIFMAIDYVTGLIVAGVFHKSTKTETGTLESRAGFKGLCRKGAMLLVVLVGYRLDLAVGTAYIKDAVIIAFMANEAISIIENAGLMGVPMNDTLKNAIDVLQKKGSGSK